MSQTPPPSELPRALAELVLAWAQAHRPDAFAATRTVMAEGKPQAVLNYLIRLVELRWEADVPWRLQAPVWALDLTNISLTVQFRPTGARMLIAGRRVKDAPWRFRDLSLLETPHDLELLLAAQAALDLERID